MEAFVWNDSFAVGHASIDAQHRHLFDLINCVGDLLVAPEMATPNEIDRVFDELTKYVNTHFAEEEQLMREWHVASAYFERHAGQHAAFTAQLSMLRKQHNRMSAAADVLHAFLVAWLAYHILAEDQVMARLILRQKNGMSPYDAWSQETDRGEHSTDALIQALQQLYNALAHLNRDLADINNALETKVAEGVRNLVQAENMASVGRLAAGIAHEINNPIGFVNSNLGTLGRYMEDLLHFALLGAATPEGELLRQRIDLDYLRTDLDDLLRESRDGIERVRRIVADLKDFAHPDESGWQDTDLIAGLESTLNILHHEIIGKAEIVRALHPLPSVYCVPAQINQVFLNLLTNALQAIPGRGTITLSSGKEGEYVWIEVADDGVGMDETVQRRMFDPFFTTQPVGGGIGLGITVAWDIAKRHGGAIDVQSTPGMGTRVCLRLPITGPATQGFTHMVAAREH